MDALTPLIESTILHAILISAINNGYDKLYKNNITFLLDVNYKAF